MQYIPQPKSTMERFSQAFAKGSEAGIGSYLGHRKEKEAEAKQNAFLKDLDPTMDWSKYTPEMKAKAFDVIMSNKSREAEQNRQFKHEMDKQKNELDGESNKQKNTAAKESDKKREENRKGIAPLQGALETIAEMRKLKSRGNIGLFSRGKAIYSSDVRKDRTQYSQLGKSLIQMASAIPIRNQKEFETLAHDLYDPNISDAGMEGILDAMENIIKRNMKEFQTDELDLQSNNSTNTVPMQDAQGNIYDIPFELQAQAKAKGLI